MWHAHRATSQQHHPRPHRDRNVIYETQPLEHKTNNDPNRGGGGGGGGGGKKYRNPLFEDGKPPEECNSEGHSNNDIGGDGNRPTSTTELLEIDIEKYEKSPRTRQSSRDNDYKHNKPRIKTTKKKNINVEISRGKKTYKCESDNFEDIDIIV